MTSSLPSEVVARRGLQAVQLTYENRMEVADLVVGCLRQHGQIDKASMRVQSFSFDVVLPNGQPMREGDWLLVSPEGAVAVLDDATFRLWFAMAERSEPLSAILTLPPSDHVG